MDDFDILQKAILTLKEAVINDFNRILNYTINLRSDYHASLFSNHLIWNFQEWWEFLCSVMRDQTCMPKCSYILKS